MEKRKCVKTDTIMVNMLVHALRDVLQEEKEQGISTQDTGDLILRLAAHQDQKFYFTGVEYRKSIQALNRLRDAYIQEGRYTDCIDTVLMRILKARYKTYRGARRHSSIRENVCSEISHT